MSLVPFRFLLRTLYACPYVADMPGDPDESLITLPADAKLDPLAAIDNEVEFAEVRIGWNATGLGITCEVRGKETDPEGAIDRPRLSDGLTLWIDTRADRTSHRASRTCHQFHFLPTGGGSDGDEPACLQTKINRALQDATIAGPSNIPFRSERIKGGYRLEAFLSANVLHGFDPEEHPKLGVFYAVRDSEKGEQTLGMSADFPFADDPSLWATLELRK